MGSEEFTVPRRTVIGGLVGAVTAGTLGATGLAQPARARTRARSPIVRGPAVRLVSGGQPRAAIVVEEPGSPLVAEAAQVLQHLVERSSGVRLRIVGPGDAFPEPAAVRLGRGPKALAAMAEAGVSLGAEHYWTHASARDVLVVGSDHDPGTDSNNYVNRTPATIWGVQRLLDDWLGVRWLWPGDGGIAVPRSSEIAVGHHTELHRPAQLNRQLRNSLNTGHSRATNAWLAEDELTRLNAEMFGWAEAHHMGTRERIAAPHSFTSWWERFGETHPDWFAVPPSGEGYAQPWPVAERVKLRITHPEVADQILADWRADGSPATWSVTPNDSTGFDTSPETMATDFPVGQDPLDVWLGSGNLSTRFVKFWNGLLERMRGERPDVKLLSLAYACYAEAPPPEAGVRVGDGTILGVVPAPWHRTGWQDWSDLGAQLYLRPNWWHAGASAPLLPLQLEGGFVEFTQAHNSAGFDFDSVMGFWGSQNPRYYMTARLSSRPELTPDDVIEEYLATFGGAADAVGAYLAHWEDFTTRASYPLGYPNYEVQDPDGLYSRAVREHGIHPGITKGSIEALAYLYGDDVVQPAAEILQQARADAAGDVDALGRISFLADGLTELTAVRDTLVLGKQDPDSAEFQTAAGELLELRKELTSRHAVYGEVAYWREQAFDQPTSI
ncbi:DUF4838 domain-containing protein [Microlunatus sp. Y2014]|uniref:DUF4838 domain-containing protein n=1 Tax=Microlunatus sp. Y2014 TaxID=3418488 RepID=UPI003DA6F2E4